MLRLTLPYPFQANHMKMPSRGRLIMNPKYRDWRAGALWSIREQVPNGIHPVITGYFHITITVDRPDRRRRDLDNLSKAVLDALKEGGVIEDDSYADRIVMEWSGRDPVPEARAMVEIRAVHGIEVVEV